ncbi:MAG: hypothetical protein CVT79_00775 [Alphaproteobacteria bacterium HGW-Alphaproteobacteria-18]|nr:MAG: hypothetical protein CVT79_00775 [Alphaproteobacteria bacterium HGW-Alphaproteobacteria-18]
MSLSKLKLPSLAFVHKWLGLIIGAWLFVLGSTGFLLLNRHWEWQGTSGLPLPGLARELGAHNDKYLWRQFQMDPANPDWRIAAGAAGAFVSEDRGESWKRVPFGDRSGHDVQGIEIAKTEPFALYAATANGIWKLNAEREGFEPVGLQGRRVTSLSSDGDTLLAVIGRSSVMETKLSELALDWTRVELGAPPAGAKAKEIDLGRFLQDLHNGRGLFGGAVDHFIWSLTSIGLALLAITGLLYWLGLKRGLEARKRAKLQGASKKPIEQWRKAVQWSFRLHASVIGIIIAIPLTITFLTGIYQDHRSDVQQSFRKIMVPDIVATPAYSTKGWAGRIYGAALAETSDGQKIALATRNGVFLSPDGGQTWAQDLTFKGPAMRMRRIGDELIVPGRMMRRVQKRDEEGWKVLDVPMGAVMSNEMTLSQGKLYWQRGENIFITTPEGEMRGKSDHNPPGLEYVPWGLLALSVHDGALFHEQWKWINDLIALAGLALVGTGILRWAKRKKW